MFSSCPEESPGHTMCTWKHSQSNISPRTSVRMFLNPFWGISSFSASSLIQCISGIDVGAGNKKTISTMVVKMMMIVTESLQADDDFDCRVESAGEDGDSEGVPWLLNECRR